MSYQERKYWKDYFPYFDSPTLIYQLTHPSMTIFFRAAILSLLCSLHSSPAWNCAIGYFYVSTVFCIVFAK